MGITCGYCARFVELFAGAVEPMNHQHAAARKTMDSQGDLASQTAAPRPVAGGEATDADDAQGDKLFLIAEELAEDSSMLPDEEGRVRIRRCAAWCRTPRCCAKPKRSPAWT